MSTRPFRRVVVSFQTLSIATLLALFFGMPGAVDAATKQQQKCTNALNKDFEKLARTTGTEFCKCIKDEAKGKLDLEGLTVSECFDADRKDKIDKGKAKTLKDYGNQCLSEPPDFGPTDPNTVNQAAVDKELALMTALFGSDIDDNITSESVDRDEAKCQQAIAKAAKKCQDTKVKEFTKCKKTALKNGADSALELEACVGDDPKDKIAKQCDQVIVLPSGKLKVDRIRKDIEKKCTAKAVDLSDAFPPCATDDPNALHACLEPQIECLVCTALNLADGLDKDCDFFDDGVSNDSCASGTPNTSARIVSGAGDLIGGPLARGRDGDFLLENEKIRVIVQKAGRNIAGIGQFGGNIIDADLVRGPNEPGLDHFEEFAFLLNVENTANYTSVFVLNDGTNGGPAVVRATGPDDLLDFINPSTVVTDFGFVFPAELDDTDQPVEISTDYILDKGASFVRMDTTVTNTSGSETIELFLGDYLSSMAQEIFHSGYGFGEPLVTTENACDPNATPCDFKAYSGEGQKAGVSYAYINETPGTTSFNTDGVQVSLLGASAILTLLGAAAPNVILTPGEAFTTTRYVAVGDGDVAAVVDIRNQIKGFATGTIKGKVSSGGSGLFEADVAVLGSMADGPSSSLNVVSHFRTDPNGNYEGTLKPGSYTLRANKDGYAFGVPDPAPVVITSGMMTTQDFDMPVPGTVKVTIADPNGAPLGGKVSIVGFDPSSDPENTQTILVISNVTGIFGRDKNPQHFGVPRVLFVDHGGDSGDFKLEPGDYRIVASHGPEYDTHSFDITVSSGSSHMLAATLTHVVDTSGFVSGDFHVHSLDSVDAPITRRDRVFSMIAEGVDFFTPSDHGHRIDFTDDILALGVEDLVSTAVNNEMTTFDYGHFNIFPVEVDPNQVNGGAFDWAGEAPPGEDFPSFGNFGLGPGDIFAGAGSDPGEEVIQANHVASFFDGGLRFNTGVEPPVSTGDPTALRLDPNVANYWDDGFTGLEIWIQTSRSQDFGSFLGQNAGNWFNLLNQGIVRTGIADSDTHHLSVFQSGFPRNMIASPTDDPGALAAIAETLAANVNDGRTTGTNGPFMTVTIEGDPNEVAGHALGLPTIVKATGGSATVSVSIQSPPWAEFDTVEYYINSETIADPNGRGGLPPLYRICPDAVQVDPNDFTVSSVAVGSSSRFEASTSLALAGLTEDTWVVVMVKGSDGVSCPLFPVIPNDIDPNSNSTVADLKTCVPGSDVGVNSLSFSNPLFLDVDGDGDYDPPGVSFQGSCP